MWLQEAPIVCRCHRTDSTATLGQRSSACAAHSFCLHGRRWAHRGERPRRCAAEECAGLSLKWHDERDDESGRAQSFCSFTLHAELRGSQVWVVGTRVSGGSEQGNETEPIQPIQIGDWPGVLACGRQM